MPDFSMTNVVLSPELTALARRILLGYVTDDMDALRIVNEEISESWEHWHILAHFFAKYYAALIVEDEGIDGALDLVQQGIAVALDAHLAGGWPSQPPRPSGRGL